MLRRVQIVEAGDANYIVGEQVERSGLLDENDRVIAQGGLRGLKENVIVGRLIPGGTGLAFHRARKETEAWEVEERKALLDAEKANMASELQAMEDTAPHGDTE